MTGKLTVDKATGHVTGPAHIEYNDPWPCGNGRPGVTGAMHGVLMHTMVGNLPGTVAWFNNPASSASAHFGIAQDGKIHQFGPIGKSWEAWHAAAANLTWYGIEHADNGDPDNPLTDAQLTASAQLTECLSAFAGFPLREDDSPSGRGLGTHSMGGAAWGGHSCPDKPPHHVRSSQRVEIIRRAKAIRAGTHAPHLVEHITAGQMSLIQLAKQHGESQNRIVLDTLAHASDAERAAFADYLVSFLPATSDQPHMPKGLHLWVRQA